MLPIRDTIPGRNPPIATWLLILANSVVFLFELTMPQPVLEQFFHLFGMVPARFSHPNWAVWVGFPVDNYWPFLTSMFLHGGWLHIIGNMWTLWIFGDNVEDRMGPVRFVIFYLLCGLAAGIVHWLTNPDSTLPTVGASGPLPASWAPICSSSLILGWLSSCRFCSSPSSSRCQRLPISDSGCSARCSVAPCRWRLRATWGALRGGRMWVVS
jgi:membrane associated rhomboid family serine protease